MNRSHALRIDYPSILSFHLCLRELLLDFLDQFKAFSNELGLVHSLVNILGQTFKLVDLLNKEIDLLGASSFLQHFETILNRDYLFSFLIVSSVIDVLLTVLLELGCHVDQDI